MMLLVIAGACADGAAVRLVETGVTTYARHYEIRRASSMSEAARVEFRSSCACVDVTPTPDARNDCLAKVKLPLVSGSQSVYVDVIVGRLKETHVLKLEQRRDRIMTVMPNESEVVVVAGRRAVTKVFVLSPRDVRPVLEIACESEGVTARCVSMRPPRTHPRWEIDVVFESRSWVKSGKHECLITLTNPAEVAEKIVVSGLVMLEVK